MLWWIKTFNDKIVVTNIKMLLGGFLLKFGLTKIEHKIFCIWFGVHAIQL